MSVQQAPRRPGADVRRWGAVYGLATWAVDSAGMPIAGVVVVGYIGKTRQTVKQREDQHRDSQSFSDLVVGGSWTIEEGLWTDAELAEREQWWIRNGVALTPGAAPLRPVYNYDFNQGNPDRIEVWRAREHRLARDPHWLPVKGARVPRQRATAAVVESSGRVGYAVGWVARRVWDHPRHAALAVGWPVVAVWAAVQVAEVPGLHAGHGLWVGCSLASLLAGVLLPGPRRRRRRR